ncbi:uncharacterized protein LOC143850597 [Tasmannia lanceolata]|uniref:uncharacterized protein LOC143850597 n=1 Tax=Tasmannia lanceolata TaxID=3420 RepID=UPI0040633967
MQGKENRRFNPKWFDDYPTWLEYSIAKEAAYCLCCYLFKSDSKAQVGSCDAFVVEGFSNWKKVERFGKHIGGPNSAHNHASIVNARFLLEQGLPFRGHDESCDSLNQENFRQHLKFMTMINEDIKRVCVEKCPGNLKLVTSDIQKDIEQMAVVLRYVDKLGHVVEHLLGITHVPNTTATSLKEEIEALLAKHKLRISRLRRQGYDGASNMQGEFNGLKALILKENEYAYLNVVGGSCNRHDIFQEIQLAKIKEALENGELSNGQGLNQETTLKRAWDTRWSSHYRTLV